MNAHDANKDRTEILKPSQSIKKIPKRFQASLVIVEGYAEGMEYPIEKEFTVIGRDKTADIALKDPLISRQHAAVIYREKNYLIKDLESTNGTHIKGARIQHIQQAELHHGDKFRIGNTTLQFILEDTGVVKTYEIK